MIFSQRPAVLLLLPVAFLGSATSALADNGALAYAHHIAPIKVDGDLSDWSEDLPIYFLENVLVGEADGRFRVAYNVEDQALYVALETVDDTHILAKDSLETWYLRDSHILYFDPEHTKSGSAPFEFSAAGDTFRSVPEERSWSVNHRREHPELASYAFVRRDGASVYEWRIDLGEAAKPGATIGLDHAIVDIDAPQASEFSAVSFWGQFPNKSSRSGRLGDVLLVPEGASMGTVTGEIAWAEGTKGPDLSGWRVRITREDEPGRWLQIATGNNGMFSFDLPAGEYTVTSPFLVYDTPEDPIYDLRLRDAGARHFVVKENGETDIGALEWTAQGPLEISSKPGFLFSYDKTKEEALTIFIEKALEYHQVAGASLALVVDGKLAYARDFGLRNRYSGEPVDADTLFQAGSITKMVFALSVLRLAERGVIDLDRPLHEYLQWDDIAEDPRSKLITARHVLSHQTGLPNWRGQTADGVLRIAFVPGTSFSYSGEAFEYLGRVLAEVTGKSLDQVLLEESLEPFGVTGNNMVFLDDGTLIDRAAIGHDIDRPNSPDLLDYVAPAFSMQTNARALAPIMETLLARRSLKEASYDAALKEQTLTLDPQSSKQWPAYYGLGIEIMETEFGKAFGHGGLNGSNHSRFEAYDEQGAGFIVLTNSDLGGQFYRDLREFLVIGRE